MKKTWNAYVNYCNEMEAKRDAARKAARKAARAAHPTFYKIMDIVSAIMVVIGFVLMIYSAVQYIAEKISQVKIVATKAVDEISAIGRKLTAEDETAKACPDEVEPESDEEVMA